MMFSFTKKIAIVVSVVTIYSKQVCGSDIIDLADMDTTERQNQVTFAIGPFPQEALSIIIEEGSKSINPGTFHRVCSGWKQMMDANNHREETQLFKKQGLFMKRCMNVCWAERFKNGVLKYTSPVDNKEQILRFSDLENVLKGTFDLSTCGDAANFLVITTDPERFFEIGGKNQGKMVTLIALHQEVEQEINSTAKPMASIMDKWDAAKAPVCIVWRCGDYKNLTWFDYLISASLSNISSTNLFDNWEKRWHKSTRLQMMIDNGADSGARTNAFMCIFGEPK